MHNKMNFSDYGCEKMLRCDGHEIRGEASWEEGGKEQHRAGLENIPMATAPSHESMGGFRGVSSEPAELPGCPQSSAHSQSSSHTKAQPQHHSQHQSTHVFPLPGSHPAGSFPFSPPDPSEPTHRSTFTLSKAQVFLKLSTLPNPHKSWHFHLLRLKMDETI